MSIDEMVQERAKLVEKEAIVQVDKKNMESEIIDWCRTNASELLKVDWLKLFRMTNTEPDRSIKNRILHGKIRNDQR
jgi:hypothetical protein